MTKKQIYKEVFGTEFIGSQIDQAVKFKFISRFDLKIIDDFNNIEEDLIVEDGIIYSSDQETEICKVEEMNILGNFEDENQCIHCEGIGYLEYGPECSKPASECCGGCYTQVKCECELYY